MKKSLLFIVILGLLCSCGTKNPNRNNPPENTPAANPTTLDSTIEETPASTEPPQPYFYVEPFTVQESKPVTSSQDEEESFEEIMSFKCTIDLPFTDNEALYDSICYWFAFNFGSNYDDNPRDVQAMVEHYKDWTLESDGDDDPEGFELEYNVKMLEANDRYVTYSYDLFFEAQSSPRASFDRRRVTFDRNTGQRFTYQMIRKDKQLEALVKEALIQQFFSNYNDDELWEVAYFRTYDDEEDGFMLPFSDPCILHDSVYFNYGTKEVADYCAGLPECGLPLQTIQPFLTEEGLRFFVTP